jgi:hypothetical protein
MDQQMTFLNGGPAQALTPASSRYSAPLIETVIGDWRFEIDRYLDKLLEGGKPMACGWLTDKFGVLADLAREDWRDPEAFQSDGCDDEDGEVRHRHTGGRGEGVTASGEGPMK